MKLPTIKNIKTQVKKLLTNPLLLNIALVGSLSFGIKLVAFYKDTLLASTFGLSLMLDTFFIAILIPGFIQNVFIGALRNIFIPNYIAELESEKNKEQFQSLVFLIVAGIMLFFTVLTYLLSDLLVESLFPGKDAAYYELVRDQLYVILPSLFFMGFSSIIGGLLEIESKFLISTISGVFPPIATIICLIFFKEQLGNIVLAVGFTAGSLLSLLFLIFFAVKEKILVFKKPRITHNSRVMIQQLPAKITAGFFTGINPFVDQYFAAQLAVGSIAAINYGTKIPSFVLGILLMAIGRVLLPHFSKLVAKDLKQGFHALFKTIRNLFFASLIVIIVLILSSEFIISLLFERNNFSAEDTILVANIQKIILIYVPFALCGITIVKFLTSINKNKFMAYTSGLSVTMNIVLNIILVKKYGVFGLALATTVVRVTISSIFFTYTHRLYRKLLLNESN